MRTLALLLCLAGVASATPNPRIAVLPVRAQGIPASTVTLLEARLLVALANAGLSARPANGRTSGVRLLSLQIMPTSATTSSTFVTVLSPTGIATARLELPGKSATLADDVPKAIASWLASGTPRNMRASTSPSTSTNTGTGTGTGTSTSTNTNTGTGTGTGTGTRPRLALIHDPATTPAALASALTSALTTTTDLTLVTATAAPPPTHTAHILDVRLTLGTRRHHIRHYLDGALAATLTIRDRAGAIIFTRRATARFSQRAHDTSAAAAEAALVRDVTAAWLASFRRQLTEDTLTRSLR